MNMSADLSLENYRRLPGLYRRWELTEVCEPNRNYQIEDAGTHADGTPLLAIYVGEAAYAGTDLGTNEVLMSGVRK